MNPAISVIVPIYNSARKGLEACIESVLNQTFTDFELILVNDGSTDESLSICNRFAGSDSRIIVLDKPNEGVSRARNVGIEKSRGEFLTFVDSDDVIEANYLEALYSKSQDVDMVVCGIKRYKSGRLFDEYPVPDCTGLNAADRFHALIQSRLVFGPYNKLFRTSIIRNNSLRFPMDIDYGEDRLFCYSFLSRSERFEFTDLVFYSYLLQAGGSLSTIERHDLFQLENSQWNELFNLYELRGYLTNKAERDLAVELYWMINDAIARKSSSGTLSCRDISSMLKVKHVDLLKKYSSEIYANRVLKFAIVNRLPRVIFAFYKLVKR